LDFVFTCNDGSATIGVVVFVTESLGFVIQPTTRLANLKKQTATPHNTMFVIIKASEFAL
jgi:hypothetical protein